MKKLFLFLTLAAGLHAQAIFRGQNVAASGAPPVNVLQTVNGAVSDAVNCIINLGTTASDTKFIAVNTAVANNLGATVVTDSKGNTYTGLTAQTVASGVQINRIYYVTNPAVGASHTVNVAAFVPSCQAITADAALTFDSENGNTNMGGGSNTDITTGSVTYPAGSLVVTGTEANNTVGVWTIDNSFLPATPPQNTGNPAPALASALAYIAPSTSGSVNPNWHLASRTNDTIAATIAVFKQ